MSRRIVAAGQLRRHVAAAPAQADASTMAADVVTLYRPPAPAAALEVPRPRWLALLERVLGGHWAGYGAAVGSVAR